MQSKWNVDSEGRRCRKQYRSPTGWGWRFFDSYCAAFNLNNPPDTETDHSICKSRVSFSWRSVILWGASRKLPRIGNVEGKSHGGGGAGIVRNNIKKEAIHFCNTHRPASYYYSMVQATVMAGASEMRGLRTCLASFLVFFSLYCVCELLLGDDAI